MTEGSSLSSDEDGSFLRDLADTGGKVAPPALGPGDRVARYVVHAELGRGGMGVVYEARDEDLGRRVAIKVLRGDHASRADRRKRFLREAKAAARVVHPNVAQILEMGECEAGPFLVFEHVPGRTLRAELRGGAMAFAEVLRVGGEVASALAKAHEAGVVHRDLKPENVILGESGAAKVLDFGLAKWAPGEETESVVSDVVTEEGHVLGSPGYMSPEQALGRRTGPATDVFALGVVLYEMCAGERPFRGATAMEAIVATSRDAVPDPRSRAPAVPRAFARLVMACLAKAPEARPSANEVAVALAGMPVRDRDRRAPVIVASTIAALGIGGLLFARGAWTEPARHVPDPAALEPSLAPALSAAPSAPAVVPMPEPPVSAPQAPHADAPPSAAKSVAHSVAAAPSARASASAPAPASAAPAPAPSSSRPRDAPGYRERK